MKKLGILILSVLAVLGCTHSHHRFNKSRLFYGSDGHYYTRGYGNDGLLYYYVWMSTSNSTINNSTSNSLGSGSWSRTSTTPPNVILETENKNVVLDDKGNPTTQEAEPVPGNDNEIEQETPTNADPDSVAIESENTSPYNDSNDSNGAGPTGEGGTSGGDSGGSSGGDGGSSSSSD